MAERTHGKGCCCNGCKERFALRMREYLRGLERVRDERDFPRRAQEGRVPPKKMKWGGR